MLAHSLDWKKAVVVQMDALPAVGVALVFCAALIKLYALAVAVVSNLR